MYFYLLNYRLWIKKEPLYSHLHYQERCVYEPFFAKYSLKKLIKNILHKLQGILGNPMTYRHLIATMHIVNFHSKRAPILCKHTCIC